MSTWLLKFALNSTLLFATLAHFCALSISGNLGVTLWWFITPHKRKAYERGNNVESICTSNPRHERGSSTVYHLFVNKYNSWHINVFLNQLFWFKEYNSQGKHCLSALEALSIILMKIYCSIIILGEDPQTQFILVSFIHWGNSECVSLSFCIKWLSILFQVGGIR